MQGHREELGWTIPEAVYPALATSENREGRGGGSGMGPSRAFGQRSPASAKSATEVQLPTLFQLCSTNVPISQFV